MQGMKLQNHSRCWLQAAVPVSQRPCSFLRCLAHGSRAAPAALRNVLAVGRLCRAGSVMTLHPLTQVPLKMKYGLTISPAAGIHVRALLKLSCLVPLVILLFMSLRFCCIVAG